MSLASESVHFPAMGKQEAAPTKQINCRLPRDLVDAIDAWRATHELQPTWTQVVEAALREWFPRKRDGGGDPRLGQRGKR